jgi:DNA-3-methyladenine glycosylase II
MPSETPYAFVMTEHPSWTPAPTGRIRVVPKADGGLWFACVRGASLALQPVLEVECEPRSDVFALQLEEPSAAVELAAALHRLGPVLRMRNGDLWDALGTAILRQVIRASQSKRLYRSFCAAHGVPVQLPGGECLRLFPSWESVLLLTDEDFASLGLSFKRRPLRAAARAFAEHGARWRELPAVPGAGAAAGAGDRCVDGGGSGRGLEQRLGAVPLLRSRGAHVGQACGASVSVARRRSRLR